jgi:hypothetical protein
MFLEELKRLTVEADMVFAKLGNTLENNHHQYHGRRISQGSWSEIENRN